MVRDSRVARMPHSDGRTLSSILSLAAGAGALGAAGRADADTMYFPVTTFTPTKTVGFGAQDLASWELSLPGDVGALKFEAVSTTNQRLVKVFGTAATGVLFAGQASTRSVIGPGTLPGVNVAFRTSAGGSASAPTPNWGAATSNNPGLPAAIIVKSLFHKNTSVDPYTYQWKGVGPGGFNDKYLFFTFTNSADSGLTDYGWIRLSATRTVGVGAAMSVTIESWAYRTGGLPIGAGQTQVTVPEIDPASASGALAAAAGALALLEQRRRRAAGEAMGGALVSGAAGLRRWRKTRAEAARPSAPAA